MIDYTQLLITLCGVFIMICIYHCSCKDKLEHMSNINDEAISMIASLYNGEKLVVNNLEVVGEAKIGGSLNVGKATTIGDVLNVGKSATINASLNVGKAAIIGPAYIGGYGGNINDMAHAQFSHKDKKGAHDFGLLHRYDGHTWLNCSNGKGINIEVNREAKFTANAAGSNLYTSTLHGVTNAVTYGQNVDARPINDSGNCFDFGSKGRTTCGNGWSIVKINKR